VVPGVHVGQGLRSPTINAVPSIPGSAGPDALEQ
jgi:hypothetical protein